MKIKKSFTFVILSLMVLMICGCFEFEERLIVNKDGSGTLEIEYWTWKDVNINDDSISLPKEKESIRKEIEEKYLSEKIKLLNLKVQEKDKTRHVRFKLSFTNILDLNEVPQFQKNKIQFKKSGNNISFIRTVFIKENEEDEKEEPENVFEKLILSMVEEGLSNIKFRFELSTPYKIAETNADWAPGDNRAVWKYRLSDVMYKKEVKMEMTTK